ncbi:hypothetical protein PIB30_016400 [Stylosanthes scabra]|uniref:Uncharacterized protein n=1 Tax=Stylosanthes scabra TaxID=79078 RepID=A0ABU6UAF3_9FABA|nr:hypothetical protein [Stylosanthes scabra]
MQFQAISTTTTMASFSPLTRFTPTPSSSSSSSSSASASHHSKPHLLNTFLTLRPRPRPSNTPFLLFSPLKASADNGVGTAVEQPPQAVPDPPPPAEAVGTNGSIGGGAVAEEVKEEEVVVVSGFVDPKWVGGTWDLKQFHKNGTTDWDAVIDAEARRRKWLEENPESSSNENPVIFDTSIIPWWAWMKRFHLPEAELLNGRAAMVGFFMAYLVDGLTGVGLVDQMNNFFCKTLLFVAVGGVLLIRKNEDVETIKKLWDETTFYDKQWQATWKEDENSSTSKKE